MASRLFRALVGVGIALGGGTAACLGSLELPAGANDAADGGADDADPSVYCDAGWPTTKTIVPSECYDPKRECVEAGPNPQCAHAYEDGGCLRIVQHPSYCVQSRWQCPEGMIPLSECPPW
jgi:hypothetical protein